MKLWRKAVSKISNTCLLVFVLVQQVEGRDRESARPLVAKGHGDGREHQTGGKHPSAGLTQAVRNGLQEGTTLIF